MNLLFDEDLNNKEHFGVILLINSVSENRFASFIKTIADKKDWIEELCCCYFEKTDDSEYYEFESFEGEDFQLCYNDFLEYVKLAIARYLIACKSEDNKTLIKMIVKETSISGILDNIDSSLATGIPLVYGE